MDAGSSSTQRVMTDWPALVETKFVEIMADEVRLGHLKTSTFRTDIWQAISKELFKRTTHRYTLPQLKSKFNRLKRNFNEFSKLRIVDGSGFRWDKDTCIVTADDDVWDKYLKSRPKHKSFRSRGCPNYKLFCEIFHKSTARGVLSRSYAQHALDSDEERAMEAEFMGNELEGMHDGDYVTMGKVRSGGPSMDMRSAKRSKSSSGKTDSLFDAWTAQSLAKVERYKRDNVATSSGQDYTITRCMQVLESINGLAAESYAATVRLFTKSDWRNIFMEMFDERKWEFLFGLP